MIMVQTPLTNDPMGKMGGPPFQMPYTLNRPAGEANRWRMHRQLLLAARPLFATLIDVTPESRNAYLYAIQNADAQLLDVIEKILEGYALTVH